MNNVLKAAGERKIKEVQMCLEGAWIKPYFYFLINFVNIWFRVSTPNIFHCSCFACAGDTTNFNLVKNQSRGHA